MKNIKQIFMVTVITILLNGCTFFNLGEPQGYCEERGCNYSDAGVCGDLFDNYKTRYNNLNDSYKHINCADCKKNK